MHSVRANPLLARSMLHNLADLVGGDWSDAHEGLFEVAAALSRFLAMSTLHDAAEPAGDVAFTGGGAVLVVLLVTGRRGTTDVHFTWYNFFADESGVALVFAVTYFT